MTTPASHSPANPEDRPEHDTQMARSAATGSDAPGGAAMGPDSAAASAVLVPVLPWRNMKLLSQALGDTVYKNSAFATAVHLEVKLGVPAAGGAIGVRVPQASPQAMGDDFWEAHQDFEFAPALRAQVEHREVLDNPDAFSDLCRRLSVSGWWGVEVSVTGENLDSELLQVARRCQDDGLHPMLSVLPGTLHSQNQAVMAAFETISLDLTHGYQPRREQLKYLSSPIVVGKIIAASTPERTNLESALRTLVLLRAGLRPQTTVDVGVVGQFDSESLTWRMREDLAFVDKTQLAGAKAKIFEALDLATALRDGKTAVASAFAADVLSRVGKVTSLPI